MEQAAPGIAEPAAAGPEVQQALAAAVVVEALLGYPLSGAGRLSTQAQGAAPAVAAAVEMRVPEEVGVYQYFLTRTALPSATGPLSPSVMR